MQGKYKKPDGEIVEIAMFDEINKMVMVSDGFRNSWHHEHEYQDWESLTPAQDSEVVEEPEIEKSNEGIVEEKPKKKTITKKKKSA